MNEKERLDEMNRKFNQILQDTGLADLFYTTSPNYRYWETKDKRQFCWTTERMDGKFWCWDYVPLGKGARSGNPTKWRLKNKVGFKKRKTAKSRAASRAKKHEAYLETKGKSK